MQTFILSAAVYLGITGSVIWKVLDSKTIAPPTHLELVRRSFKVRFNASNARLCVFVDLSQMMIFDADKTLTNGEVFCHITFWFFNALKI